MEPNNNPPPPFWSPPSTTRRRHSYSPPFISLPVLIILLPTVALILLFFIIRPFLSLTSQFFKPSSVKKSWDSFNVFLVLFAVICGLFARRNDDGQTAAEVEETRVSDVRTVDDSGVKENREAGFSQQWFGISERRISDPLRRTPATGMTRLRRNSSYPDLRQESLWEIDNERPQFRFFDDFEINKYRFKEESPESKVAPVDSFLANYPSPAPERLKSPILTPTPPPPPPLPRKPRRTYQSVKKNSKIEKTQTPPPPPPPPPRQVIPPSPIRIKLEEKFGKRERKKTNVKKEIAMALASLYKQKKRNKQKIEPQPPSPSPPSPPPPPPPSVFRGLFKKSNKNKRVHSESPLPPSIPDSLKKMNPTQIPSPPPPPPKSPRRRNSTTNSRPRPPLPTRVHNSYVENENINSGGQSPFMTIPPAPPPPPPPQFKMTELKSGADGRGGFVGSKIPESSRSRSPEPENVVPPSSKEMPDIVGGGGPVFCPSPDVNVKAAKFIARLRDEWKLEKMNSVREKERLGQSPNYQTLMGQGPNIQD